MKNKIIQNSIFIIGFLFLSVPLQAAKNINADCEQYMREVILLSKIFKSESTIKSKLNKMIKNDKLNEYLQNQWLNYVKNDKDITPNSIYMDEKKLVKECVQFVKG